MLGIELLTISFWNSCVVFRFQLERRQQLRENPMACSEKSHTSGSFRFELFLVSSLFFAQLFKSQSQLSVTCLHMRSSHVLHVSQIDGSTLKTLCMQHGPLITFHLNLPHGNAVVCYSSKDEAAKAQKSLHM